MNEGRGGKAECRCVKTIPKSDQREREGGRGWGKKNMYDLASPLRFEVLVLGSLSVSASSSQTFATLAGGFIVRVVHHLLEGKPSISAFYTTYPLKPISTIKLYIKKPHSFIPEKLSNKFSEVYSFLSNEVERQFSSIPFYPKKKKKKGVSKKKNQKKG